MDRNEFIKKVENAFEMTFSVSGKRFTVIDENEKGFSIAEQNHQETEQYFPDAKALVNGYMIDGKSVGEYATTIQIIEYCGIEE